MQLQMKEILPRIGYTSLPIIAISSLENRGINELKKDLASMIVRNPHQIIHTQDTPVERVDRLFADREEPVRVMKKATRSWRPVEKIPILGKY